MRRRKKCVYVSWDTLYSDQSKPQSNPSELIIRLSSITTDNNQLAHSSSLLFSCSRLTPKQFWIIQQKKNSNTFKMPRVCMCMRVRVSCVWGSKGMFLWRFYFSVRLRGNRGQCWYSHSLISHSNWHSNMGHTHVCDLYEWVNTHQSTILQDLSWRKRVCVWKDVKFKLSNCI